MSWLGDLWDAGTELASGALEFASENKEAIGLGISGASAYYGYQQQQEAIAAQESATAQALALQEKQLQAELQASRLTAPNEQASIDLLSSTSRVSGSVNDFLYEMNKADTKSVGLGIPDYEKSLGLA